MTLDHMARTPEGALQLDLTCPATLEAPLAELIGLLINGGAARDVADALDVIFLAGFAQLRGQQTLRSLQPCT